MAEKILQRIDGIMKQIDYVQTEMNGISFNAFKNRRLLPQAICFAISQIGERMNTLEGLLGEKYPDFPWKAARQMRNTIVHDYDGVDFEKVYLTAVNDLPELKTRFLQVKEDIKKLCNYSLSTKRLFIRPWDDFDADELYELAKDPEIGFWCGFEPHKHIRDTFFVLHNFLEVKETYAICLIENSKIIGSIGLHFHTEIAKNDDECELGYWIGKPYWNNGYVTKAAKEVIRHAFDDLNISTIWCGRYEGNEKSKRVQEKLGFVFRHRYEKTEVPHLKTYRVNYISALTKEDWKKR